MKHLYTIWILCALVGCTATKQKETPPNVLFISIDDLNDWVGVLKGYPGVRTPNIDRLARESILFTRAYTAAPLCNPSRTAILTGIQPYTSGVYANKQPLRQSPVLRNATTLPQYFRENGYKAMGSGKIFHYAHDTVSWDLYWPSINKIRPDDPEPRQKPAHGMPIQGKFFDWGAMDIAPSAMGDWKIASWIADQLKQDHEKPFFLACGFYKPHLPWYLPKNYFDRYPLDKIELPDVNEHDLDDVPTIGKHLTEVRVPNRKVPGDSLPGDHPLVLQYGQWKQGVQAYLAAISFADDCLGKVLDALENSRYSDNTIVVLWSDHGYHLGEKIHWRKSTLWEEATRSLLAIRAPGVTESEKQVDWPVSLIDIYPTLLDLCKLPDNESLEGRSLKPLLNDHSMTWDQPVISTFGYKNHAVRSKRYRYIQYADGTEELYDHETDSLEWNNLAGLSEYEIIKSELAQSLPEKSFRFTSKDTKK